MVLYFAYGSNMNPGRMLARGVATLRAVRERRLGILRGWRLVFDKPFETLSGAAAANIRHTGRADEVVEGIVYDLTPDGLAALDCYEAVDLGHYRREEVRLETAAGEVEAITYVALGTTGAEAPTTEDYLGHILAGATHLSPGYVARLLRTPTVPNRCAAAPRRAAIADAI